MNCDETFYFQICGIGYNLRICMNCDMYDLTENHFMVEIDGRLYDITGDVTGEYTPIPWDFYDDIVHKRRIERDCVLFANLKDT